jgi:hypothetical protein
VWLFGLGLGYWIGLQVAITKKKMEFLQAMTEVKAIELLAGAVTQELKKRRSVKVAQPAQGAGSDVKQQ